MKRFKWSDFVILGLILLAWFIYLWIMGFDFVKFITSSNTILFGILTIIASGFWISEIVKRKIHL